MKQLISDSIFQTQDWRTPFVTNNLCIKQNDKRSLVVSRFFSEKLDTQTELLYIHFPIIFKDNCILYYYQYNVMITNKIPISQ